jgi:hypothetical protein
VYLESGKGGVWRPVVMPSYHAAGACKVICRGCFEEIGGFVPAAGWDTVDEIRAISKGWKTGHFADLRMKHHKSEGSGIGTIRTSVMHGEIYYRTGGSGLFFLLKFLRRMGTKPYGVGALALLWGYLRALRERKELLVSQAEAACYRDLLSRRVQARTKALFARGPASSIP